MAEYDGAPDSLAPYNGAEVVVHIGNLTWSLAATRISGVFVWKIINQKKMREILYRTFMLGGPPHGDSESVKHFMDTGDLCLRPLHGRSEVLQRGQGAKIAIPGLAEPSYALGGVISKLSIIPFHQD